MAWEALKTRTPPEQLAAAYRAMNIGRWLAVSRVADQF
jgi:hypothetical protein